VGHDLHRAHEGRDLPVALGAETVAVGHQPLRRDPRKLLEPMQVLEGVGEAVEAALLEEGAESQLDPRRVTQGLVPRAILFEAGHHLIRCRILGAERIDLRIGGGVDVGDEVAESVAVHRVAQPQLRLDLVALGDGDLAHVVAEAGDSEPLGFVPAGGGPGPPAEAPGDHGILPVTDDGLPSATQSRLDERELPVAMGRLVQVHEIHVDLGPGEVAIELRVQV
jgi:hypothetical protein